MPPDLLPIRSTSQTSQVFELMPMGRALWNSTKIAVLGTLGTVSRLSPRTPSLRSSSR